MKKIFRRLIAFSIICALALSMTATGGAFNAPVSTIKVGLFYNTTALDGANLQNLSGYGSGYQMGYYDSNRNFVPIGATISTEKISVVIDKNVSYSSGNYFAGLEGTNHVGCFHVQFNDAYSSFGEARAVADMYADGFVKYQSGTFYVSVGSFTSYDAASSAIAANGYSNCAINSGSSHTVTVVATETGRILFEFDYGGTYSLAIMPLSVSGEKCQTWFKGFKYNGGFQYSRISGGALTVTNFVDIEDYVKGVVPYEMVNTWPIEAIKVGAVSARTYVMSHLNAHKSYGFDVCTLEHCQVYRGTNHANSTTDAACEQTAGKYVTYDGKLCETYYSSSNGGASESSENVWLNKLPYLRGVVDPYEASAAHEIPGYNWTVTYTRAELTTRMQNKGFNCSTIVSVAISKYTDSGNVYTVTLTDSNGKVFNISKGDNIRSVLGLKSIHFGLVGATNNNTPSSGSVYVNGSTDTIDGNLSGAYAVGADGTVGAVGSSNVYAINSKGEVELLSDGSVSVGSVASGSSFSFKGTGNGHNVGMSQWGAYSMAKYHGKTYDEILKFYYTGVTIE